MRKTNSKGEERENSRIDKIYDLWSNIDTEEQLDCYHKFLDELKLEYHREFFKNLGPNQIIKERWFLQYLSSRYDL